MNRVKPLRKIGTSTGFIFNKEEKEMFNLKVGELFEVSIKKYNQKGDME